MKEIMSKRVRRILNPETPLQIRLFQLLSTIALAEFIVVSIYTILSGGDAVHITIMLIGTVLFSTTVALTFKTGKTRVGSALSSLIYFLMYPLTFFSSGGMYGGAPVVFAFALVYVYLVTQGWERAACLAACIIGSGVCYLVSYRFPELLDRHTVQAEHAESFLSILLVTLLLCLLFAFVTGVYRAENRIVQKQKKEIEALNQAQKRFFSSMSHEIRTPVNAIIGLNEMTLREDIPSEVRENALNIEAAGRSLLHTVNEILDMSRLETGRMELVTDDYQTAAMLSDIVSMTWSLAQEKGIEYRIKADPGLPSVLRGDEVRIKQILLNVITNAVKYTKKGFVTLTVGGRKAGEGKYWLICDVTDTGIGIREENIPFLFTAFQRVDEAETHAIEGTGLGLSIVKQLLDMMQGTVSVDSEYGKGSTFHIELPQDVGNAMPMGEVNLTRMGKENPSHSPGMLSSSQLMILAVDDTPMNLMVIKKLLRDTKATVDTADSGAEALQKAMDTRYDVILMDHQMPEMDGITCLHRIRTQENGKCRDSKIICLTANAGLEMEKHYRQEGFDGFLAKPVRGKALENEIERLTGEIGQSNRPHA